MGHQELWDSAGSCAIAPSQGLEEIWHPHRIEAGSVQEANADPICLVFMCARKVYLLLHGCALAHGNCPSYRIAPGVSGGSNQNSRQHGGGRYQARFAARIDLPFDVVLGDVRDFVGCDACKLALGLGGEYEARVEPYITARKGEGIDGGVRYDEESEIVFALVSEAHQTVSEILNVLIDLRIADEASRVAQASHDHATDLPFLALGQHRIRGAADVGQIGGLSAYSADGACRYQGEA